MPRIKSAKKRQRQTAVRTARNKAQRSALRSAVKKARTPATAEETAGAFAAAQTLIHRNVANRTKSRLAKLANKAAKAG